MRWMIGARDRMLKVSSVGVFFEDGRIVFSIPLLETSEGVTAIDVERLVNTLGAVAAGVLNDLVDKQVRRERRRAKAVRP